MSTDDKNRCKGECYGASICPYAEIEYDLDGYLKYIKCRLNREIELVTNYG